MTQQSPPAVEETSQWNSTVAWARPAASSALLGLVFAVAAGWPSAAPAAEAHSCALFDHEHAGWTAILDRHVRDGMVDYSGLSRGGQAELAAYLESLQSVCEDQFDRWTRDQKLAFWINAYNAYTVRLILDHHPIESIRKIGWMRGAAFKQKFIPLKNLRGKTISLNEIEHEIIRKQFAEPRIHFALVCASKGCPVLRPEAYRAAALERQLTASAREFIQDASKNRFDAGSRTLHLSSIFKWFRGDFEKGGQTLPEFIARYSDEATAAALRDGEVRIDFLDYDWSLNGR